MARCTLPYWNGTNSAWGLRGFWQQALHSGWTQHRRGDGRYDLAVYPAQYLGAEGRCPARPAWIYTDYHDQHAYLHGWWHHVQRRLAFGYDQLFCLRPGG